MRASPTVCCRCYHHSRSSLSESPHPSELAELLDSRLCSLEPDHSATISGQLVPLLDQGLGS